MPRTVKKKLAADIEINAFNMKKYLDDKNITKENKDRISDVIDMYKGRSIKSSATASKMIKLLASRYPKSIDKGIKLYDELTKEIVKIRVIFYRKERDDEMENPARKKKYLNKLLPNFRAYWIGYLNVLAKREDIKDYRDKVLVRPTPNTTEAECRVE